MTKIFFDTEFTGLQKFTTLISIGLISECGKTFYAEFTDYDYSQLNDWIKDNVINNLKYSDNKIGIINDDMKSFEIKGDITSISVYLKMWLSQWEKVEMWSDCLAYDWVLFNNIFGTAFDIPKNVYYIPFDISTLFKINDIDPDISREEFSKLQDNPQKHNALWDAKVIKECYNLLTTKQI